MLTLKTLDLFLFRLVHGMKVISIVICVLTAASVFGQTAGRISIADVRHEIGVAARRQHCICVTEPYLDAEALNALLLELNRSASTAPPSAPPDGTDDGQVKRYGKFVAFRGAASGGSVPCITLEEGRHCVESLAKVLQPYTPIIDFRSDKSSLQRLSELFDASDALSAELNDQEVNLNISDKKYIKVSQLNETQKSFVHSFVYWRYIKDSFDEIKYVTRQYNTLFRENPRFCFVERAGIETFGYTIAKEHYRERRTLHTPLSHPDNILFVNGGYAIRSISIKGTEMAIVDATLPTEQTEQEVKSEAGSPRLPTLFGQDSPHNPDIPTALTDKQVSLFGASAEEIATADYLDLAHAIAFLYDLDVRSQSGSGLLIRARQPRIETRIESLPFNLKNIIPLSLYHNLAIVVADKARSPRRIGDRNSRTEKLTGIALMGLGNAAVQRVRAKANPLLAKSKDGTAELKSFDAEQRNLLSFITLCTALKSVFPIIDAPVPAFVSRFNDVIIIRTTSQSPSRSKLYSISLGVPDGNGEISITPGLTFPAEN